MKTFIISIGMICLVGCSSFKHTQAEIQKIEIRKAIVVEKLNNNAQKYIEAAVEILQKEHRTPELDLTLRLLTDTQKIIGIPSTDNALNVDKLLQPNDKTLTRTETDTAELVKERQALEKAKAIQEQKLVMEAEQIDEENSKGLFTRIKDSLVRVVTYAGYAAIVVIGMMLLVIGLKRKL